MGPELTASQAEASKYTLRELTRFLNETKGTNPRKFVRSVQHAMKKEGHGVLSPRKRFRLRKWVTTNTV
jgi:3-methyladenine DNA glycosylase AlkC